jgi:hypothetical protein
VGGLSRSELHNPDGIQFDDLARCRLVECTGRGLRERRFQREFRRQYSELGGQSIR